MWHVYTACVHAGVYYAAVQENSFCKEMNKTRRAHSTQSKPDTERRAWQGPFHLRKLRGRRRSKSRTAVARERKEGRGGRGVDGWDAACPVRRETPQGSLRCDILGWIQGRKKSLHGKPAEAGGSWTVTGRC